MTMALVAMLVRAALPAGTMLANNDGQVVITLCGGSTMTLDLGSKGEHGKHSQHQAPCPYAAATHGAPPPSDTATFALPTAYVALETPREVRPGQGLAAPPPPSTGPPILS
ncbi:MAG: hypothetical protein QM759_07775 [Terricaulis sp.]